MPKVSVRFDPIGVITEKTECVAGERLFFLQTSIYRETKWFFFTREQRILPNIQLPAQCGPVFFHDRNPEPVHMIGPVSPETPLQCLDCGEPYRRTLLGHNYEWMYTLLACSPHPRQVYVDIFPKYMTGTEHDWTNAFFGIDIPHKLPEGVVISNSQSADEHFLELQKRIQPAYTLSAEGIRKRKE